MRLVHRHRVLLLIIVAMISPALLFCFPPIPQPITYHNFADSRAAFGIPNFGDVIGNVAFMFIGIWGMLATGRKSGAYRTKVERWVWRLFFFASFLVAFGSGYYHLDPNNTTLIWDRLPMTIAFMSLFSLMIMERIDIKIGLALLPIFVLAGIGSVIYWAYSESLGYGDLRPYILVQFFPMLAIVIMLWLFPSRYSDSCYLIYTLGWYVFAKLLEHFDKELFSLFHQMISGHTIKHLVAAVAVGCMVKYIMVSKRI